MSAKIPLINQIKNKSKVLLDEHYQKIETVIIE